MVYELRGYDIDPNRWEEWLAWAENRAFPVLFEKFQFRLVGIWQTVAKEGEAPAATNLHYILAWESEAEMRERWAAAFASDAWKAAWAEAVEPATGERKYHRQTHSVLMRALPRSPL